MSLAKHIRPNKYSSLCIIITRNAQQSRHKLINHYEYSKKAKAVASVKLKYRTENCTKKQYLNENRTAIDGSLWQHAKYMSLLKDKRTHIDHKKSVAILRQCEKDGIRPNIVIYSKVMHNCSKCFTPNMVFIKLIEEMIMKYDIKPNYIIFSSVLNAFLKNESYNDCIILYGITRNSIQMNLKMLLKNYEKSREISYILNNEILLNSIKDIESNLICCNVVLKCIGKMGDMNKVTQFFQAMIKSDMLPNDVTLNTIINIFASNQKIEKMEKMFDWWLNNYKLLQCSPDIITINSMLNGYSKSKEFEKCEKLFNKYCSKEHNPTQNGSLLNPTQITFGHIITCAANCMDITNEINNEIENEKYKFQMRDNGLKYYRQMQLIYGMDDYYNLCTASLMNVCLQCNDLKTLLKVFEERRRKDNTDRTMYNIALRALFQNGLIGEALSLFGEGVELNVLKYLSPNDGPYSMDLHHFNIASAVIAIMHNFKTLCETIKARQTFKVPSIWIVVGKGKHSTNILLLKDTLPQMLKDERLFYPALHNYIPHWNQGRIKLDDESVLKYLAFQLKMDPQELRPRFQVFNCEGND